MSDDALPSAFTLRVPEMVPTNRSQLTSGALHVESNGDPFGRLILCVHGLSANYRSFDQFAPALAEADHHVVTMDLRGRGRREITPPRYPWLRLPPAAQYPRQFSRLILGDAVERA